MIGTPFRPIAVLALTVLSRPGPRPAQAPTGWLVVGHEHDRGGHGHDQQRPG